LDNDAFIVFLLRFLGSPKRYLLRKAKFDIFFRASEFFKGNYCIKILFPRKGSIRRAADDEQIKVISEVLYSRHLSQPFRHDALLRKALKVAMSAHVFTGKLKRRIFWL